ncbi:F-box/FBD/LRR-repeat protein [Gossypium australe]|uniref:F-box/FBD/LRR-repeat protein n=1 Tax=Gossypium australe TaxID=47621 RepID=A0A5B6UCZ1_9ROSI|nr:F-box/FBD/LRR-repeat protein [Gossypium australe]
MYRKYNHRYKDCLRYKSKKILLLENDLIFHIPFGGCFPNLKVLNIDLHLTLLNGVFLNKLFQSCPLLENLCCIPTLKHLGFDFNVDEFKSCGHNKFIINTPNLEYLAIKDPSLSSFRIHEIPTLSLADLSIGKFNYVHDFQV